MIISALVIFLGALQLDCCSEQLRTPSNSTVPRLPKGSEFCDYCGTEHDEATQVSSEHVIPYAIGGSNDVTITVCEESNNNRLGGQVGWSRYRSPYN